MAQHDRFHYKSLDELKEDMTRMGLDIPVSANVAVLSRPINIGNKTVPNRLAINPMEGCDGTPEGKPSDLTRRRYRRFGNGGAGLVWYEATAVVNEGRANPRQLQINKETSADVAATLRGIAGGCEDGGAWPSLFRSAAYPLRAVQQTGQCPGADHRRCQSLSRCQASRCPRDFR